MFTNPSAMEPLFPTSHLDQLQNLALELIHKSARLEGKLNTITRRSMSRLLHNTNSYYSNLIEGHHTHPYDIEKALKKDFSKDPAKRALQIESAAHVEVQKLIESRLVETPHLEIGSEAFICWIHSEFYKLMPPEFKNVENPQTQKIEQVMPGKLRRVNVAVGLHVAPEAEQLSHFLKRFNQAYFSHSLSKIQQIIAIAASHQRLAWIHPFLDGNGRVGRLFTQAFLNQAGLDAGGIWTVTRGLARKKQRYLEMLAGADEPRRGDLDGRGNLSDAGLAQFCIFFLETCLDQIEFMDSILELEGLQQRIQGFVEKQSYFKKLRPEAAYLLRDVLLRGEIPRGEASRITGLPERTARNILSDLTQAGLLVSDSPKTPVRLGFPANCVGYYFPRLYPEGMDSFI